MNEPTIKQDRPPVPKATPILSFGPVRLAASDRPVPIELRVVAPATGDNLPVILLSHGHGASNYLASMRGYGPLADYYAAHGFVVILPTHLNSRTLPPDPTNPEGPLFWRSRARDMHVILDKLEEIENAVPGLAGRLNKDRIAAVGHSLGAHTVTMLAGSRVTDPVTGAVVDLKDERIKAAVMFSPPGDGRDMAPWAAERFPAIGANDFGHMKLPSLVITGTEDFASVFSERKDWRSDAYRLSPSPKALLTLEGAGHLFGGISGYDAKETSDESPDRVANVQRISWAYIRSALFPDDNAWSIIRDEIASNPSIGALQTK